MLRGYPPNSAPSPVSRMSLESVSQSWYVSKFHINLYLNPLLKTTDHLLTFTTLFSSSAGQSCCTPSLTRPHCNDSSSVRECRAWVCEQKVKSRVNVCECVCVSVRCAQQVAHSTYRSKVLAQYAANHLG